MKETVLRAAKPPDADDLKVFLIRHELLRSKVLNASYLVTSIMKILKLKSSRIIIF